MPETLLRTKLFVPPFRPTLVPRPRLIERLRQAAALLQRLLVTAEAGGRTLRVIEILILQSLAFGVGNDLARAMTALGRALILAEPGGFIRVFVDEGRPMLFLLHEAVKHDLSPAYARRLLAAFAAVEPSRTRPESPYNPNC